MIARLFEKLGFSSFAERALLVFFLLTLPLANPWIRGDGVGYYAFARALLIEHNLDFTQDYLHANTSFRENRVDESGQPRDDYRTPTGHLENHFTIGPAILWSPFLIAAHVVVLAARTFGAQVAADGFSAPYRYAMALGTAVYGFLGLFLAFQIAKRFVEERWAALAAIGIWWGSSLPVYMYFNPSWSHAHSAFVVALFFWYWLTTGQERSVRQWIILGAICGLMLNVYYANAMLLALVAVETLAALRDARKESRASSIPQLVGNRVLFALVAAVCFLPTLITKKIIYGRFFETGYIPIGLWNWKSPNFLHVLFSANHGLFSWTPLLLFAALGIVAFWRKAPRVGGCALCAVLAFYYFIASYPDWAGISSFGNRFFISLTVFWVIGLAFFLQRAAGFFRSRKAATVFSSLFLSCFVFWNVGLMFQWGSHLIPARGAVVWGEVAHNQFVVVPQQIAGQMHAYFFRRKELMRSIEQRDVQQLRQQTSH
ncbi:MAG: glycosyltransferase family 39 protein [Acidobacteria bacterium]|nr:glycosyltransferase family 39 protein [Acidobacteriota bacterium]MBS1865489.1 glycosyltransferase family 39 protein [Acidobacteriota bacterium]